MTDMKHAQAEVTVTITVKGENELARRRSLDRVMEGIFREGGVQSARRSDETGKATIVTVHEHWIDTDFATTLAGAR